MRKGRQRKRHVSYNAEKREIRFEGKIRDTSLRIVTNALKEIEKQSHDPIKFFINCEGGDRDIALDIHHTLHNTPSPVETIGFGEVASGGLLIFQGGDKRFAGSGCKFKFHQACVELKRRLYNGAVLDEIARELFQYDSDARYILTSRGSDRIKILNLFKKNSVITCENALKLKIIDSVWTHPIPKP